MSPAEIVCFAKVRLRDGREVKAHVEGPQDRQPISRQTAFHMLLAASLLLEEAEPTVLPRLRRRMELLRERMEDAIERENHAQSVVASRPVLPTLEDAEKGDGA